MRPMRLEELLRSCGLEAPAAAAEREVRNITCDSRKVQAGDVFVAFPGLSSDGRDYLEDALGRGALCAVAEQGTLNRSGLPIVEVAGARKVYALLNHVRWGRVSDRLKMIGITGTNGKTTTAYLIEAMLNAFEPAALLGTICTRYRSGTDSVSREAEKTTQDPEDLQPFLSEGESNGVRAAVMEVSSHALDQERLAGMSFDAVLFTNFTQDHLDYHKTMEEYLRAKLKILSLRKPGAPVGFNADDPALSKIPEFIPGALGFGVSPQSEYRIRSAQTGLEGSRFELSGPGASLSVTTPLVGLHNIYNTAGALTLLLALGYRPEPMLEALQSFGGVPGRLERIDAGQEFGVFVDYAHTPDGLKRVLSAVKPFTRGRVLLLFGCGGDRDRSKRALMARAAEAVADRVLLTSDNPRNERPLDIVREIQSGFSAGFDRYEVEIDRRKAIRRILLSALPGDVVLVAGKGHENYQIIGKEKLPFSDPEECRRVLSGR